MVSAGLLGLHGPAYLTRKKALSVRKGFNGTKDSDQGRKKSVGISCNVPLLPLPKEYTVPLSEITILLKKPADAETIFTPSKELMSFGVSW